MTQIDCIPNKAKRKWIKRIYHGLRGCPEYKIWAAVKTRCHNANVNNYQNYGGRGIQMCERWENDFRTFLEDMGPRPSPKHSIDRIDNNGNYEPNNCRWATHIEQRRNTRRNHYLTYKSETLTLVEWSERTGIKAPTIRARINSYHLSVEDALTRPVK